VILLADVPTQVEGHVRARVARHIEHQFKPAVQRFERIVPLAVDGDNKGFRAGYRDGCQTRRRRVAKAEAHSRARSGSDF
jgi:hypothetical protein